VDHCKIPLRALRACGKLMNSHRAGRDHEWL
jgi:hypothetical protein